MRLVITEKPSVARDLARVLGVRAEGRNYFESGTLCISWFRGHLLELSKPEVYDPAWRVWSLERLPMLPDTFRLEVRKDASDQWKIIKSLLSRGDITEVVNACDAGREGELIFRYAYQHARCRKPVLRFWTSSLTPEAIRKAWDGLRPGAAFDALGDAARCRSEADWLVGMNATRALTCHNHAAGGEALLSVGRVQTPTLAMIVARDREIAAFVPETFWRVKATHEADGQTWEASWFRPGVPEAKDTREASEEPVAERLSSESDARAIVAAVTGRQAVISSASRQQTRERPPLLFDLTQLQRRANQRYGMDAQRTLDVAQALYERHKLITYPRTDSRYLTSDDATMLPSLIDTLAQMPNYAPFCEVARKRAANPGSRVVDANEVGDHHALLPTTTRVEPRRLSPDEKRIYDLIARRMLAALSPDALFDKTVLITQVEVESGALPASLDTPLHFRASGRVCREPGWQAVEPPTKRAEHDLPPVHEGAHALITDAKSVEGQTRPPKPHDDASLLQAMETAGRSLEDRELKRVMRDMGLGTPATRASILQTLIERHYVRREERALVATPVGVALIDAIASEALRSAELTGQWEQRLGFVARGTETGHAFMADVRAHVGRMVTELSSRSIEPVSDASREKGASIGACPVCGKPVRKQKWGYTCDTGRACAFFVSTRIAGKAITLAHVKELLGPTHTTPVIEGFKSKAGKLFAAALTVGEGGRVVFSFPDPPKEAQRSASEASEPRASRAEPTPQDPVGMLCPSCGQGHLIRGREAWGCERWREGCTWRLAFDDEQGMPLTAAQAVARVQRARLAFSAVHKQAP